jgi:hypothetical protein
MKLLRLVDKEAEYRNYLEILALDDDFMGVLRRYNQQKRLIVMKQIIDDILRDNPEGNGDWEFIGWRDRELNGGAK